MVKYKNDWSETVLKNAIERNTSISGTLRDIGVVPTGGNFKHFHRLVKRYGLDTSHFLGKASSVGPKEYRRKPLKKILVANYTYNLKHNIKERIVQAGLLKWCCAGCNIDSWTTTICPNDTKITLQLDHINGDPTDNRIENLRFLCPNCHSKTNNYCGKKNRKPDKICRCGKKMCRKSLSCMSCVIKKTKIEWPSVTNIKKKLEIMSCEALARELGVCSNSIRKRLLKYSCD